ncbi:GNAT family N-acetyltransferase [Microbulbifer yueqingensis]|uniref:Acetyltransferase (GNAT) domain-containing protein n=1 Tax=Microbulbifer yueqingensis TaxID=658219 RepID=A0A1G9CQY2_9GAMM|nr:GNAT family N-acetyltransferase [Microbulbifer yueqingensis]SDK54027.1 Acetyltransferase (GNAT) domain-containing protein [Microbulbifer yueqingensis]
MKYSLSAKNLVCRNLESRAGYCAGLINPDHTKEITSIVRSDSGLLSYTFNQAVTNSVVPALILKRFVVDYFAERHSPFTLWHCASKPMDEAELAELGLVHRDTLVAMAIEVQRLAGDEKVPDELRDRLEIVAVGGEQLAEYGELQARALEGTREAPQIRKFYQKLADIPEHKRSRLKYYMARLDGEAVASGCLFASADALGIYDLQTVEAHQGKGIGLALFHHLLAQALHSHHKYAVALTPENRQDAYLDAGFFAVGQVSRYRYEP